MTSSLQGDGPDAIDPSAMSTTSTSKKPLVSSSLCDNFNRLEKTWNVYNKFDSLERQWSKTMSSSGNRSMASNNSSTRSSGPRETTATATEKVVLKVKDLEDQQLTQLQVFATEEKQQQQQQQQLQLDLGEPEIAKAEEPGFVIKRRGAKRPRRLLALTKVRHWDVTPETGTKPVANNDASENEQSTSIDGNGDGDLVIEELASSSSSDNEEEELVFESSPLVLSSLMALDQEETAPLPSKHLTTSRDTNDESRDEQSSYQDLTERVLLSMPNHQLWETANEDARYGEWKDAYRGAKKAMGIGSGSSLPLSQQLQLELQPETTIVFSATAHRDDDAAIAIDPFGSSTDDDGDGIIEEREGVEAEPGHNTKGHVPTRNNNQKESNGAEILVEGGLLSRSTKRMNTLQPVLRDLLQFRLSAVSAIVIQSWVRTKLAQRAYVNIREAGKQSSAQPIVIRRRRDLLSPKIALVQSTRKFQSLERCRQSAIIIQAAYRCWDCRRDFLELRNTVVRAQHFSRVFLQRRQKTADAAQAQYAWLNRGNACSQWSFDGTGISALSFDNSYLEDEPLSTPLHQPQYPNAITLDVEDLIFAASPLPPRPPSAPRSRPTLQISTSSNALTPNLPPLSPSMQSRGSPGRPARQSRVKTRLDIIKYHQQKKEMRSKDPTGLSPHRTDQLGAEQSIFRDCMGAATSPITNISGISSTLSFNSPNRTTSYKCSPLASIVSDSPDETGVVRCRHNDQTKSPSIPMRKLSLKRKLDLKIKLKAQNHSSHVQTSKGKQAIVESFPIQPTAPVEAMKEPSVFISVSAATAAQMGASIQIQKIWRSYLSRLTFTSLLVQKSTVVCECTNGKVSQDRHLRQSAQVMCANKAIGQVGCAGANERLSYGEDEIVAEWENVVFVSFPVLGGGTVNTFSTVYVLSTIKRTLRMERMSRKNVFMVVIKSALMQHLSEQAQKVSRLSMLERSLMRRRAPVEREAAIQIQKIVRGAICSCYHGLAKASALVLQKNTRAWLSCLAFRRAKLASKKIQSFFRGELVRGIVFQYWPARIALKGFWSVHRKQKMATADAFASRIQALFRGNRWRQELHDRSFCADVIQATFRAFIAEKHFLRLRRSCITLQTIARHKIVLRIARDNQAAALRIARDNKAANFIQQWWRFGQYDRMLRGLCATIIQASYRRYRYCHTFLASRSAAITVQSAFRGYTDRQDIQKCLQASISIQCFVRGALLRSQLTFSATKIQTQFRRFSAETKYHHILWSITLLQVQTRKMIEMKRDRERQAASRVQAFWRGHCTRLDFVYSIDCITSIQSAYRAYRQEKAFRNALDAARLIQARWRGHAQRFDFHIHRGAIIFLQRTLRRMHILRMHRNAATRIQTVWRNARARSCYQRKRSVTIRVQSAGRKWLRARKLAALKEGALLAQRMVRGFLQRSTFLRVQKSVLKIQGIIRSCMKRRKVMATLLQAATRRLLLQKTFHATKAASVVFQRQWRMQASRNEYLLLCKKTRFLQSTVRVNLKRKKERRVLAAVKIQSWYRCNIQIYKFVIDHFSIVMAQSTWRSFQKKRDYQEIRKACLTLQPFFRKCLAAKAKLGAVNRIQCFARQLTAKKELLAAIAQKKKADKVIALRARRKMKMLTARERLSSTIFLQHAWRRYKKCARNRAAALIQRFLLERIEAEKHKEECERAVNYIQRNWRMFRCKKALFVQRKACFTLVSHLRAHRKGRSDRASYLKLRRGVTVLQSISRGSLCHTSFAKLRHRLEYLKARARYWHSLKLKAVVLLQKRWRLYQCHSGFLKLHKATVVLQSKCRLRRARESYGKVRSGVTLIQALAKHSFHLKSTSSTLIQKSWRKSSVRRKYCRMLYYIMCIQRQSRRKPFCFVFKKASFLIFQKKIKCITQEQQIRRKVSAATLIQRNWRCYHARFNLLIKIICGTILQSVYRGRCQRLLYQESRRSATCIQHVWREYVRRDNVHLESASASRIQRAWRRKHIDSMRRAVVRLQSIWRRHALQSKHVAFCRVTVAFQKQSKRQFSEKVRAAILHQRNARTKQERKRLIQFSASVTCIQALASWRKTRLNNGWMVALQGYSRDRRTRLEFLWLQSLSRVHFRRLPWQIQERLSFRSLRAMQVRQWGMGEQLKHTHNDVFEIEAVPWQPTFVARLVPHLSYKEPAACTPQPSREVSALVLQIPTVSADTMLSCVRLVESVYQRLNEILLTATAVHVGIDSEGSFSELRAQDNGQIQLVNHMSPITLPGICSSASTLSLEFVMNNLTMLRNERSFAEYVRRMLQDLILPAHARPRCLLICPVNSRAAVLTHEYAWFPRASIHCFVMIPTGKTRIVATFAFLASVANQMNRPALAFSFWALSISILAQGQDQRRRHNQQATLYILLENAATIIQARWRSYSIGILFLQKRNSCVVLQRVVRNWQAEREQAEVISATLFLQFWLLAFHQRLAFLKSKNATITIQRYLKKSLAAKEIQDAMQKVLVRRVKLLCAVILQRWYRMVAAKSKFHLLKEGSAHRQEDAATCLAHWWRQQKQQRRSRTAATSPRFETHVEISAVALAIREYCEDRQPASQALAVEDRLLLCTLSSSATSNEDEDSFKAMDLVRYHKSEADDVVYEDDLPISPITMLFCIDDDLVRITETESGMELTTKQHQQNNKNGMVLNASSWCGINSFFP